MAVCRKVVLRVGMVVAAFVGTACSDSSITRPNADLLPPLPLPGGLTVSTVTTGSSIPAGYTVIVDGSQSQQIAATGLVTFTGLAAGNHSVFLSGVPSNCSVSGSNPQTVDVLAGLVGTTAFTVSCSATPTTGTLKVTNNTQGSVPTTNYTVKVSGQSGTASQQMAPNGSATFQNLAPGTYSVTLSGQPTNCAVTNTNPQNATVQAGQTATVSFALSCNAPPTTGTLKVTNNTQGSVPTTNYTVNVNGQLGTVSQQMAPNGSTTFANLPPASYTVTVSGQPTNCTVTSANPQSVTVQAGQTATVSFSLSCTTPPTTGNLTVANVTSGSSIPSSFTVTVDPGTAGAVSRTMAPNQSATFTGLAAGSHSVGLAVASNCTVSGANPQTGINVAAGGTGSTSFSVSCSATTGTGTGTLTVTASTTGAVPTGVYVVSATGPSAPNGASDVVAPNGTLSEQVLAGSYTVTLSGFPQNCTVTSGNPQSVTVPTGGTATAAFTVSCSATSGTGTGTLTVTASTTGAVPTGVYVVSATGPSAPNGASDVVAPNGTLSEQVLAGSYTVTLSGFPQNCTVTSANPVSVTVPSGGTGTAAFTVSCSATTGTLTVNTRTTGSVPITNYTVTVGGASVSIAPNGTISGSVAAGSYTVTLSGFPQNCTVTSTGGPSQSVTVPAGGTATVLFALSCSSGTLTVTNTTSGPVPTTTYTVTVSGPSGTVTASMAPNGQVGPAQVAPGTYTVSLSGLPATCTVQNGTSQNVTVPGGGSATASFAISCM
jgi:hypothetical protein